MRIYEPGESGEAGAETTELELNTETVPGDCVTHHHGGEELDEAGDDDVGGSHGAQQQILHILAETGAVLDGDEDDDVEDHADDGQTEVQACEDSSSRDLINVEDMCQVDHAQLN